MPSPVCVTQYYNPGGWVYKVYVAGGPLYVHKRPSIPDFNVDTTKGQHKVAYFDSLKALPTALTSDISQPQKELIDSTSKPFLDALQIISTFINKQLGLQLFGFDILVVKQQDQDEDKIGLVVVDVNFFPSFKEIPEAPQAIRKMFKRVFQPYSEIA
eukprot:TRINITY_DN13682_c0_g1_i1.p1 TRINITY_DN13682_c0_g1~~TRINITY_DN13682_c0_g1_i1.p1  ORF type:complete len:181 (-),score=27.26 TRINITY_DN13682_c0_g1_i1:122-592(-)